MIRSARRSVGVLLGLLVGVAASLPASSELVVEAIPDAHVDGPPPAPRAARDLPCERLCLGLTVGYGVGLETRRQQVGEDVAELQLLRLDPTLRWGFAQVGDGQAWFHGAFSAVLEGSALFSVAPNRGYGGGGLLLLRYDFAPRWRFTPYSEGGAGVGRIDLDLESQSDGTAFLVTWGLGLRLPLTTRTAVVSALRWHHISNGQTARPNAGVDEVVLLIGLELD